MTVRELDEVARLPNSGLVQVDDPVWWSDPAGWSAEAVRPDPAGQP